MCRLLELNPLSRPDPAKRMRSGSKSGRFRAGCGIAKVFPGCTRGLEKVISATVIGAAGPRMSRAVEADLDCGARFWIGQ